MFVVTILLIYPQMVSELYILQHTVYFPSTLCMTSLIHMCYAVFRIYAIPLPFLVHPASLRQSQGTWCSPKCPRCESSLSPFHPFISRQGRTSCMSYLFITFKTPVTISVWVWNWELNTLRLINTPQVGSGAFWIKIFIN